MTGFTVDAADLAVDWLNANRPVWSQAYCVAISPSSYAIGPDSRCSDSGPMTVISIQGDDLSLPGESTPWGAQDGNGLRHAMVTVSAKLAVELCTRLSSDAAREAAEHRQEPAS